MYHSWEIYAESICDIVLRPRHPCYAEAQRIVSLFLACKSQRPQHSSLALSKARFTVTISLTVIRRRERYQYNNPGVQHRSILQMSDSGIKPDFLAMSRPIREVQSMSQHECDRFHQLYFRLWGLSIMSRASSKVGVPKGSVVLMGICTTSCSRPHVLRLAFCLHSYDSCYLEKQLLTSNSLIGGGSIDGSPSNCLYKSDGTQDDG